ncbi:thioredoxin family protein [bacterium]|nr:thioredoxin family protein [bacterium]
MSTQEFKLETFEAAMAQQERPVVVDFWASWSVPCLLFKDRLTEVANILSDSDAIMGSVNIDDFPELTERFSIITIPTTLIIYKDKIVKQYIGIQEPEVLVDAVFEMVGKKPKEPGTETQEATK